MQHKRPESDQGLTFQHRILDVNKLDADKKDYDSKAIKIVNIIDYLVNPSILRKNYLIVENL